MKYCYDSEWDEFEFMEVFKNSQNSANKELSYGREINGVQEKYGVLV